MFFLSTIIPLNFGAVCVVSGKQRGDFDGI